MLAAHRLTRVAISTLETIALPTRAHAASFFVGPAALHSGEDCIFFLKQQHQQQQQQLQQRAWQSRRYIHLSTTTLAGQKDRLSRGLSRSGTEFGVLTDSPDWSYADGTPAPPTPSRMKRARNQLSVQMRIKQLLDEVDSSANVESEDSKGEAK